jgi:putative inorganic carbon (HCO3(-)) transporter
MAIRDYMYVADTSDLEKARVGGIAEHSNSLGAFFCYYMFLFPGVMLAYPKKFKSWLLLIPFLLCFRGIMVTFSRGAYLAFAFGSLVFAWFRSKWLLLAAFLLALFAVVNPWILPSGIRYRLGQTVQDPSVLQEANLESLEQGLESSASTRLTLWKGAVRMIAEHPFTGVGYGAFPHFIPYYVDPEKEVPHMDAHNSYLLIAAEMGVPTLLVFLVVVAMAFHYTAWLARHTQDTLLKGMAYGFIGGLGGLLMANMFGSRMDAQQVSGYFWILCGLMMRGVLIERQGAAALAAVPVKRRVKTVSF